MSERADVEQIRPDEQMCRLIDWAIDEAMLRLPDSACGPVWREWAQSWIQGERSPAACVFAAHKSSSLVASPLSQIAWGAKEACYTTPTSRWLVLRYVADAMAAIGAEFPDILSDGVAPRQMISP